MSVFVRGIRRPSGSTVEVEIKETGDGGEAPSKHLSQLVKYNYSTVINPPPNSGQVRANTVVAADITEFWIHRLDFDNVDIKFLFLAQAKQGSELYVQDINDSSSFAMFLITQQPSDNGDYVGLMVEREYGNGVPLAGSGILLGVLI